MKKLSKKFLVLLLVVTFIVTGMLAGCGSAKPVDSSASAVTAAASSVAAAVEPVKKAKTTVDFWYLWTAASEVGIVNGLIDEYNKSQDSYEVKGISKDVQAITVAIAGGNGPDVADDFDYRIAGYSDTGIIEPLDTYIAKSGYDTTDFIGAAMKACQYKDKTYALPISVTTYMLYYNKKLFAEAGISEAPKTDKELLADGILLTKLNADKTIDVLGYPDYPFVYYNTPMTFALGGDFADASGKLTPNNVGTIAAINNVVEYRKKFGVDNVVKFSTAAKYMDATDPFATGKQAIRIDGPWFGNHLKNVLKSDVDYGVMPFPYPEGKPELAGGGSLETSIIYISATSKNKEGAWSFISWFTDKNNIVKFDSQMSNLPARKSIMADPEITKIPNFDAFGTQALSPNMKVFPRIANQAEYTNIMKDEIELAVNLKKSVADALKAADAKAAALK